METLQGINPESGGGNEINKQKDIGMLEEIRSWSNEIPDEIIHLGEFKVRKNQWVVIQWILHGIKEDYQLSDEERKGIVEFEQKFYNEDFINRPTTKEDIAEGNEFVDFLLATLRSK